MSIIIHVPHNMLGQPVLCMACKPRKVKTKHQVLDRALANTHVHV